MNYYNRFGQLVFSEPRGLAAGYEWPQLSLHRGDLHQVLVDAVLERLGREPIAMNHQCANVEQDDVGVTVHFVDAGRQRCRRCAARRRSAATASIPRYAASSIRTRGRCATRASTCGAA